MNLSGAIFAGVKAALSVAGVAATYAREDVSLELTALPGRNGQTATGREMARVQLGDADFIIRTADLGELGLPLDGDRLTVDSGGRLQVLSLQQLPGGERAWDYLPGNEFLRLHLTYVSDDVGQPVSHPAPVPTPRPPAAVLLVETIDDANAADSVTYTATRLTRILAARVYQLPLPSTDITDNVNITLQTTTITIEAAEPLGNIRIILEGV